MNDILSVTKISDRKQILKEFLRANYGKLNQQDIEIFKELFKRHYIPSNEDKKFNSDEIQEVTINYHPVYQRNKCTKKNVSTSTKQIQDIEI